MQHIFIILLVVCGLSWAQESKPATSSSIPVTGTDETIRGIEQGRVSAIMRAGASGDRVFVPYLRDQLHNKTKNKTDNSPAPSAGLALAKLGEPDQLAELKCDVYDGPELPAAALTYVGGWFAIQLYERLLDDYKNFPKSSFRRQNKRDIDVLIQPPSWYALVELPKIVPDPPVGSSVAPKYEEKETRIKMWKDWIAEHRQSLSKLPPTAQDLDLSGNSCKGRKRK